MRNVFTVWSLAGLACLGLFGCSGPSLPTGGPVSVQLIQPSGARCQYRVAPAQVQTLDSLAEVRGRIGRVVISDLDLNSSPQILDVGLGFRTVRTRFTSGSDGYFPMDFQTLSAVSLYYAIETGYLLHSRLDPAADFVANVPGFAEKTAIVLDANRTETDGKVTLTLLDNAEYLPHEFSNNGVRDFRNYFFSYPSDDEIGKTPLGLNLGILVHEYTHLVMQYLFREPLRKNGTARFSASTDAVLSSIDEGLADYFGYVASGDPSYFLCSFPNENRDLSVPKNYTQKLDQALKGDANYDVHIGGAVFASINYEIAEAMGQGGREENGKLLLKLMQNLSTCTGLLAAGATNTLSVTFGKIAACHAGLDASRTGLIQGIYDSHLEVNER